MVSFSLFFASGVWLLQQQAALPDLRWSGLLIIPLAALRLPRHTVWQRISRTSLLLILAACSGFFYAAWISSASPLNCLLHGRAVTLR
jgi:hypothetical protein